MNNKRAKITVDILMIIFFALSFVRWEGSNGLIFHALAGTAFAWLMLMHLYLNRKWLVAVTKSMREKKANKKTKRLYIIDMMLITAWGIAIITGFLAIPPFFYGIEALGVFGRIHAISSRVGGILILVHIYQHLGQIRAYMGIKKKMRPC